MPRDDGGSPEMAALAASNAINDGAEIILGPLFAQAVSAVAPVARAQGVPVIAFSSDRSVGGDGVYLLSFQPEDEVARIVSYAARHGHSNFAALVPANAYGGKVEKAFRESVADQRGKVVDVERFEQKPELVGTPAQAVAASSPDAILVAQGGAMLKAIAPALSRDAVGETSGHQPVAGFHDPARDAAGGRLVRGTPRGPMAQLRRALFTLPMARAAAHRQPRL